MDQKMSEPKIIPSDSDVAPQKLSQHLKSAGVTILKISVAAGLIYWLVKKGALDLNVFGQLIDPIFVLVGLTTMFVCFAANNYRWKLLLKALGYNLSTWLLLKLTLIGLFFNFAFPGGVGGDVVKGYYLVKASEHDHSRTRSFLTILVDRALGMYNLIFMTLLISCFYMDIIWTSELFKTLYSGLVLVFAVLSFGLALAFFRGKSVARILGRIKSGRALSKIKEIFEILDEYGHRPLLLFQVVLLSWASQASQILLIMYIGSKLGFSIPVGIYFFLVPLGIVSTLLPIAPAGVGLAQASLLFLFKSYQPGTESVGTIGATSLQVFTFAWGIVGAFFFLRMKSEMRARRPQ